MEIGIFGKLMPLLLLATTAPTPQQEILSILNAEKTNHSFLTYSQHYLDKDNHAVEYTGTLYLQIESFSLDSCALTMNVIVQDRYIGTEEKQKHFKKIESLPERQVSTYRYSYRINLKDIPKLQADPIEGRPSQFVENTGFVCKENVACKLQWLHLKASSPAIKENREFDSLMNFKQSVQSIEIPMTSRDTALRMATSIEHLAETCH